jgi:hypothetical protein
LGRACLRIRARQMSSHGSCCSEPNARASDVASRLSQRTSCGRTHGDWAYARLSRAKRASHVSGARAPLLESGPPRHQRESRSSRPTTGRSVEGSRGHNHHAADLGPTSVATLLSRTTRRMTVGRLRGRPKPRISSHFLMRMRGLEPPPGYPDTDLNRARLPIPPHPRIGGGSGHILAARPTAVGPPDAARVRRALQGVCALC